MRRSTWIIAALMLLIGTVNAQSQKLGVTGGVNISNFNGIGNATTKNGVIIGAFAEYDFIGGFAIQPEVLFSMKGAKGSTTTPTVTQSTWTANYVEVPILLKYDVLSLNILPMNVDLYAGPDFAFNVASKDETSLGTVSQTTDEKSNTQPFDFNIAVGGGPNLNLGPMTVGAELRYTFATGSVFKSGASSAQFGSAKNGVWSIMASVGF